MKNCRPEEIALKSFFLGPQAENGPWLLSAVVQCLEQWFAWRRSIHPEDGPVISAVDQSHPLFLKRKNDLQNLTGDLLNRFEKEIPKFSPRYVGHMFSETSLPALLGHIITLLHNPNNISGESSRVGIQIEREAIALLSKMLGFNQNTSCGHFTSGGTVANFESLQRALTRMLLWLSAESSEKLFATAHRGWKDFDKSKVFANLNNNGLFNAYSQIRERFSEKFEGPVVLVPENMHYSWKKGMGLLGLGQRALWPIELDKNGHTSQKDLLKKILLAEKTQTPILMVVSILGSTELGSIDPVHQTNAQLKQFEKKGIHIWHHIDAAYGGFLATLKTSKLISAEGKKALGSIDGAQSVTVDPHKLGYVPFSSGAFLTKEKRDYYLNSIDAPYLQVSKKDPGPQTLEGSRSAAGAVATWMTLKGIGTDKNGYGRIVERTLKNRFAAEKVLQKNIPQLRVAPGCDSNILCFCIAFKGEKLSQTNRRTQKLFEKFGPHNGGPFTVAKTELRVKAYGALLSDYTAKWRAVRDDDKVVLIRLTLMNPFLTTKESKISYLDHFAEEILRAIKA